MSVSTVTVAAAARKDTVFTCLQVAMLVGCTIIFC